MIIYNNIIIYGALTHSHTFPPFWNVIDLFTFFFFGMFEQYNRRADFEKN